MTLLPVVVLVFLVAAPATGQQPGASAEDQLQAHAAAAAEKVSRQDYRGALIDYEAILHLRPDSAETHANAGMMRHLVGDLNGAVADFELALHLNPRLEAATLLCGLDLLSLHRPTEAVDYLRRAVQGNPSESRASTGLGEALFSIGRPEEALSSYQTSLRLNPNDTDAAYGAGLAYLSIMKDSVERLGEVGRNSVYSQLLLADAKATQNRWQQAIQILSRIPDSSALGVPCLSATLGFARLHVGETAQAETEFRKEPRGNVCPLNALGLSRIAFERGEIPAGLAMLEKSWERDPMVIKANANLLWSGLDDTAVTRIHDALHDTSVSVKPRLTKALLASLDTPAPGEPEFTVPAGGGLPITTEESPESFCSSGYYSACAAALRPLLPTLATKRLLLLAQSAFYSGDADTTLKAAVRVLKTAPVEPAALFWKARAAQRLALDELAVMQRSGPDSAHLHFLFAEAYRQQDNTDAAQREYQRALAMSPDDVPARIGLARVLIASGDPNGPALLKEVLARDPANAEASYLMGEVLVSQVRYADARPFLTTALTGGDYGVRAHSLLARIAYEEGNWSEALKELQPCLKYDKRGSYHYRLYQVYKKLGNAPAAAEAFRTAKLLLAQANTE